MKSNPYHMTRISKLRRYSKIMIPFVGSVTFVSSYVNSSGKHVIAYQQTPSHCAQRAEFSTDALIEVSWMPPARL